MKKIYIFAAVLALLTLSLNAQLKATKNGVVQPNVPTQKVDIKLDGYFPAGPVRAGEVTPPHTWGFSSSELEGWSYMDANNDNSTWGISSEQARYTYNSSNAADDWLFTPGVYLVAGRIYSFALDTKAQSTTYPERLEVKLLTEISQTGINNATSVIGSTNVDYTAYRTLSNGNVTVSTTGYYYFGIHAISNRDMYYLWVDNVVIDVVSDPVHDLEITLSASTNVNAGGTITVQATVTNIGDYAESGYTVNITVNGNVISTQTGGSLAVGASETFTIQYPTTGSDGGTTVNFGANVICANDAEASNDNATASTAVIAMPPPENVAATADGNNGTMTWDAPTISTLQATEGFDDTSMFPTFSIGDITATQHTGSIGDWTVYDSSGHFVYGPQGGSYTNINQPSAWMVMNPSSAGWNIDTPHSGSQFMISFCDAGDENGNNIQATNHWLISPELSGDAQTITFWERVITTQYGYETYEVWASSTNNDYSSFSRVQSFPSNATTWTERSVTLPAGTKYFAIRHTSNDIFGLMIDDITYVPAPLEPVSYNVYLDGQFMGNVDANTFSYTFNNLADGEYECSVSAVYPDGYESVAVPATFTISNINPAIEISPETQTINDAAAGTLTVTGTDIEGNINVSAANNDWYLNPTSLGNTGGEVSVSYTGRALSASTTVTASAANDNTVTATATVNYVADVYIVGNFGNGWNFSDDTHPMSYNNGIYTATLTANAGDYILFARLLGNDNPWGTRDVFGPVSGGDWWMQGNSAGGNLNLDASNCIYFPEGGTYTITINANDGTFTITKPSEGQTASPVITYEVGDEYVTITATGDGTVTLNVPGYDPVSGEGSVSITIPRGYANNTITVTATAKEVNKDESVPTTEHITIPAGSGWTEMDGTYDNPNDLLSFLKDGEDIMMVDQFRVSTLNNDHPDHYTYTLRQTVNGETQTSTPTSIPVYKTSSTMQGLYTMEQIIGDKDMHLKANVLNTEMDYDVHPDRNTLYYSLYRGDLENNSVYPVIDADHRVSQLQRFSEMVGEYPQYFLFESHQQDVAPRYDHIGSQMVERLDTNWVVGEYQDQLPYVPVIWTSGLYTARGDGLNNTYGSDIKRQTLGEVTAEAKIYYTTSTWGKFKDSNNVEYCIYYPEIKITGVCPVTVTAGDGDVYTYEPYMFRAWCTYEGARDFKSIDNELLDNGPKSVPFMLDSVIVVDPSQNIVTIGRDWLPSDTYKLPWAFGVPVTEDPQNVTFIVRFYYRQVVQEGGQQEGGSKLRLGNDAEEFFISQGEPSAQSVVTAVNELFGGSEVVSVTYYNAQGMQSSKPFKGMNIIVTRYSDGSTSTMKVMK